MQVFSDEAFNVPDSTDWLGTPLACLMPVEQAFRCHVCKDFYDSPMLTSCNHTFCSLCIRRCLSVDSKCPLCRATDQESKLRGNWALREAVEAFTKSRRAILEFAKAPPPALQSPTEQSNSPPKRKATEMHGAKDEEDQETKRPRRSTRSTKTRAAELTAAILQEEEDTTTPSADPDYVDQPPDDGLVACPICLTRMKEQQVDRHIDTSCPGSPQAAAAASKRQSAVAQTPQPSSTFSSFNTRLGQSTQPQKAPERLPALAYSMLKDTALRKKLSELGLSTHGSRQLLEKRHKEWITLWNANCDSSRPKKRSELLRDLDEWERTVGNPGGGSRIGGFGMTIGGGGAGQGPMARAQAAGAEIKDKEFDGKAWANRYGGSFGDLIKQARKGIQRQTLLDGGENSGESGAKEKKETETETEKEDTPADLPLPRPDQGDGESSSMAPPTPMDIVPPSSPPRLDEQGGDSGMDDEQLEVIPGTPEKGNSKWETSQQQKQQQQPPIAGDA
ncbi:hypothetical protein QBC45DRAFT_421293 [Copromyces sp. CBS 386.78]|nr:hypothetical protein QBC45DRAFT_421293 [Copromyces sp. CBS 386.78]